MSTQEEKQFIRGHFRGGTWFHSTYLWDKAIPELVTEGFFKPLTALVDSPAAKHWYVEPNCQVGDLNKYFSTWALNEFGLCQFGYDFQI